MRMTVRYEEDPKDTRRFECLHMGDWCLFDLALLAVDWISLATVMLSGYRGTASFLRVLRVAKVMRLARIARLVRMSRVARTLDDWVDRRASGWKSLIKMVCILGIALLFGHLVSCAWYAIASFPSDTGRSWLELRVGDDRIYTGMNTLFLYTSSLHWSVAQMTLGCNEIVSTNSGERVFSVLLLFVGMFLSSTLVSAFSATLIDCQMQARERNEQVRLLRRFLAQNPIDMALSIRIQQQVEHRIRRVPMLKDTDVPALKLIASSLRAELRFEIFRDHIIRYPLFRIWTNLSLVTAQEFCAECIDFAVPQPSDIFFSSSHLCNDAYFIVNGKIKYTQYPESSVVGVKTETYVQNQWMCEAALWTKWIHVGDAEALDAVKLVVVPCDRLLETMKKHRVIHQITAEYCKQFCSRICECRQWRNVTYTVFQVASVVESLGGPRKHRQHHTEAV